MVGSALIAHNFTPQRYSHGRPSATVAPDPADPSKTIPAPYNAGNSGGSNLGPSNSALIGRLRNDVDRLKAEYPGQKVPVDLVTASGSGLDPDISPEAALFQVPRVAKARQVSEDVLRELVANHVEKPFFGIIGEPHVNVLALNRALDALSKK